MANGNGSNGGLRIVLPDGSMQERVMGWFSQAGLPIQIHNARTKEGTFPLGSVKFQRPQESPNYIRPGMFDFGITGEDWLESFKREQTFEYPCPTVLHTIPAGRKGDRPVKIILAVKEDSPYQNARDIPRDAIIATEYVTLTTSFFQSLRGSNYVRVVQSLGNTEHKIEFGATAIVDVTETGSSLKENGLRIIAELMQSNIALVCHPETYEIAEKRQKIDLMVNLIAGAIRASSYVWVVANVPEAVLNQAGEALGGLKAPTVSRLLGRADWYSLGAAVAKTEEVFVIGRLHELGVTDILVNRNISNIMG